MAIARDAATDGGLTSSNTSKTYSHTVAGSDRYLIVTVYIDLDEDYVSSVTYAGVAMIRIARHEGAGKSQYVYGLVAPATGANNVVITVDASTNIVSYAVSYTGVHQTYPIDGANCDDNNGISSGAWNGTEVTTRHTDCWGILSSVKTAGGTMSAGGGSNELADGDGCGLFDSNGALGAPAAESMNSFASDGTQNWSQIMVTIIPAGATIDKTPTLVSTKNSNNADFSFNVPAGLDMPVLLVCIGTHQGVITGVTYNGDAMTKLAEGSSSFDEDGSIWMLVNPDVGNNTVDITRSSGSWHGATALLFDFVKQTTTVVTASEGGNESSPDINIFPPSNKCLIVAAIGAEDQTYGDSNSWWISNIRGQEYEVMGVQMYRQATAASYNVEFFLESGQRYGLAVVALEPAYGELVQTLTVNGEGTDATGFGAEGGDYTRVQSDDGDTTRLYSPTNNHVRQFTLTNTSGLSGKTINGVRVYFKVKSIGAYTGDFQIGIRTNSTDYWSATKQHIDTTYTLFSEVWLVNPNTGVAWTTTDLDALEIGIKKTDADGTAVTYAYAEVIYTDAAGSLYSQDCNETITVVDTLTKNAGKRANETVTVVDTLTKATSRSLGEVVTIVDTLRKSLSRSLGEVVTVVDQAVSTAVSKVKTLNETVTVVDTISKHPSRSLGETITVVDTLSRAMTKVLNEAVSIVDTITRAISRAFGENVTVVDTVNKSTSRSLNENITVVDTISRSLSRSLNEVVSVVDTISRSISRSFNEAFSVVDSITKALSRSFGEGVTVTDRTNVDISRSFGENVTVQDSISKSTNRSFSENITVVDSITRAISKTFRETISIVDTIFSFVPEVLGRSKTALFQSKRITALKQRVNNVILKQRK